MTSPSSTLSCVTPIAMVVMDRAGSFSFISETAEKYWDDAWAPIVGPFDTERVQHQTMGQQVLQSGCAACFYGNGVGGNRIFWTCTPMGTDQPLDRVLFTAFNFAPLRRTIAKNAKQQAAAKFSERLDVPLKAIIGLTHALTLDLKESCIDKAARIEEAATMLQEELHRLKKRMSTER